MIILLEVEHIFHYSLLFSFIENLYFVFYPGEEIRWKNSHPVGLLGNGFFTPVNFCISYSDTGATGCIIDILILNFLFCKTFFFRVLAWRHRAWVGLFIWTFQSFEFLYIVFLASKKQGGSRYQKYKVNQESTSCAKINIDNITFEPFL